jgi:glycosyltransferase involved in cell wall biosynthesis
VDIIFASGNPHLPQMWGGVEVNTHELASELNKQDYHVSVLAKLSRRSASSLYRAARLSLAGQSFLADDTLGYSVYRAIRPDRAIAKLPRSTVAVVQNAGMLGLAREFSRTGVPTVAYLHGLEFETWPSPSSDRYCAFPFQGYIANSGFTAERFRRKHGLDAIVVPPFFRRERYATQVRGRMVTFINPAPEKGLDLALSIAARCPKIPFCFVRGWPLSLRKLARLKARIGRLGNIELRERTSDMRTVYRETRVLLAPSQWEAETWGRVASEAQFSGIPVIASNRGGLPEAVGPGGVIIGFDEPVEIWAEAVQRLWSDEENHAALARAALHHAARPLLDPSCQIKTLVSALERFLG